MVPDAEPQRNAEGGPIHGPAIVGSENPCRAQNRLGLGASQVRVEPLDHGTGSLQEHHPLQQGRMIGVRNHRVGSTIRKAGRQHQRVRNEAAHSIAGRRKLRGLSDGVAEDESGLHRRSTGRACASTASAARP